MSEDIKAEFWRGIIAEGVRAIGNGARAGVNDIVHMADDLVKRYAARFDPETDVTSLIATFDADRERVKAEIEELKRKQVEDQLRQYREQGPWSAGTPLVLKGSGERVEVVKDDRGPGVRVKLSSGRSLTVQRADLGWPEANADEPEMPTPVGLVQ
jgi:hypothetical protein